MWKTTTILIGAIILALCSISEVSCSELSFQSSVCKLLSSNIVASSPWTTYPIIFEPIHRGRITIWTGVTTLPTSEFTCMVQQGSNNSILIEFSDFANKLEWSFDDLNRDTTYFGNTITHVNGIHIKMDVKDGQLNSYLECNKVANVELLDSEKSIGKLITSCNDCSPQVIPLVEAQIKEIIKTRSMDHIKSKLYWDVNQLVYSHHFDTPFSIQE